MNKHQERQRERLTRYLKNRAELGEQLAWEILVTEYKDSRHHIIGPHTDGVPLATGFNRMRPMTERLGVREEFVDVSADGRDAALANLVTCTCRDAGSDEVPVLCEAYLEATRRAFPQVTAESLLHQVHGAHVCVHRYSRLEQDQ
jgi:hypothetical protein